jgi:hypothetical protein
MGNKNDLNEKYEIMSYCKKKYKGLTMVCGSIICTLPNVNGGYIQKNLNYEYQCLNCEKKEKRKREIYLKKEKILNSNELYIVFSKKEIFEIRKSITSLHKEFNEDFFKLFNENKERFLKKINSKFKEFGIKSVYLGEYCLFNNNDHKELFDNNRSNQEFMDL